ncbi:hypothetical protein C0J52_17195 [Blattella germanica]|nr:hypothetical protein C0J52_17195 [Blattella germanica]
MITIYLVEILIMKVMQMKLKMKKNGDERGTNEKWFCRIRKQKEEEEQNVLLEDDSQIFKLGIAALKRMNSQEQAHASLKRSVSDPSPDAKRPYKLLTKRGSFLARGESALAKIAKIAEVSAGGPVVGGPKNSRNFVFATISPKKNPEQEKPVQVMKKRASTFVATPPPAKKLRFEKSRGKRLLDLLNQ